MGGYKLNKNRRFETPAIHGQTHPVAPARGVPVGRIGSFVFKTKHIDDISSAIENALQKA